LNILFIANDVTLCNNTGDAVHVRELVLNLAKLGNKIIVVGRDLEGVTGSEYEELQKPLEDLYANENIQVVLMKSRLKLAYLWNRDIVTVRSLLKLLKGTKIDLVYSRSFTGHTEALIKNLSQAPLVLEINGMAIEERAALLGKKTYLSYGLMKSLARVFFQSATKIVSVTEDIKSQLVKNYDVDESRIVVVPNGVNEQLFKPSSEAGRQIRTRLNLDKKAEVICFVGNFEPWHGIEGLVEAAEFVVKARPKVKFLLVGEGGLRPKIENNIRDRGLKNNFIFTGRVPYEDVPRYINSSDICVAPYSLKEGELREYSPLKLYSYLGCGKPLVGTEVGGVSDVIQASKAGVIVRADDPGKLANGIEKLLDEPSSLKKMGMKGRKYIIENCTWKQTAEKVNDICKNAVSN
jgi:glycosyltransferase involved in cell wall biosynthesis